MSNTLTPHKHAALILRWADHVATGKIAAGWYYLMAKTSCGMTIMYGGGAHFMCDWRAEDEYHIVMDCKHSDYRLPTKKIVIEVELSDDEISKLHRSYNQPYLGLGGCWYTLNNAILKALKEAK